MPTGYTAPVADGSVTDFRTFALQCARAFGACIMQRDDPMKDPPKHREPTDYHRKRLAEAQEELPKILDMTNEEATQAATADYEQAQAYYVKYEREAEEEDRRYSEMAAKVDAWEPPTADHDALKAFMLEQLRTSMRGDFRLTAPVLQTGTEWKAERIQKLERDITYHTKKEAEEQERVAGANAWIDALYESLSGEPVNA